MSMLGVLTLLTLLGSTIAFDIDLRIVNGSRVETKEFPFMVSIRRAYTNTHVCGGTILNSIWLLTAGHCVAGIRPEFLNIQYGVTTISRSGPRIVNVTRVIVFEGYFVPAVLNDIAMLKVQIPFLFGKSVQPVKLPRMYQLTPENAPATLIGWGLDKSRGTVQKDLQQVGLRIYSREECDKRHIFPIHPTNICAGVEGGGKGQCNGDSGGPLLVNSRQVGISSWSMKPCGLAPYPGVFTEVANFINWIDYVMEEYGDSLEL